MNFDELLKQGMRRIQKLTDNRESVEAYRMGFEDGLKAANEMQQKVANLKPQPAENQEIGERK